MAYEQILTARWIMPVAGPPLKDGIVAVCGQTITAVEAHGLRTPDIDFGNVAIIPGLVNAHTHLDLSGLRGKVPAGADFIGWLKQIIAHRRTQTIQQIDAAIQLGLSESLNYGTTLICDIAAGGASWGCLAAAPVNSVIFHEVLGLLTSRLPQIENDIITWLRGKSITDRCMVGLSPHAPYSVNSAALVRTMQFALPVAIHVAETRDEVRLIEQKDGPFVAFLTELGVWEPESLIPSYEYILRHSVAPDPLLLIHANYLPPKIAIPLNATIVYCPRTHTAFGHAPHPFREFLKRGVRVALGTDSLASNPDLDLLAEARFIYDMYPEFPGEQLLRMATLSGAEALGWAETTGSLEPGKSADLVVVPLPDIESADPYELLFQQGPTRNAPRRTMWRGKMESDTEKLNRCASDTVETRPEG